MKKTLLALITILASGIVIAGNSNGNKSGHFIPDSLFKFSAINVFDSVIFDLSQEVSTVSSVEFPVYFLSDDTVNALDFAFKFDLSKFAFDTVLNLTNYLTVIAHVAPDSVLRLTSYSLQRITNDTPLVSVRFTKITGQQLCTQDIDSIYSYPLHSYLNGDPCAVKIIECNATGISEINNTFSEIIIYPNPVSEVLSIEASQNATIQLLDISSKQIILQANLIAHQKQEINTRNIANGIYLIKIFDDTSLSVKKIMINNSE